MSEFEVFSAALGVSLRRLRLNCSLTQRILRYAEYVEKIDQIKTPLESNLCRTKTDKSFRPHLILQHNFLRYIAPIRIVDRALGRDTDQRETHVGTGPVEGAVCALGAWTFI